MQVLVRTPSDVLTVDVVRRVCDGDPLPDGLLRLLHAHLPRLLHHVRAPLHQGEAHNCRSRMPPLPQPHRLQSSGPLFHSKSLPSFLFLFCIQYLSSFAIHCFLNKCPDFGIGFSSRQLLRVILHHIPPHVAVPVGSA